MGHRLFLNDNGNKMARREDPLDCLPTAVILNVDCKAKGSKVNGNRNEYLHKVPLTNLQDWCFRLQHAVTE